MNDLRPVVVVLFSAHIYSQQFPMFGYISHRLYNFGVTVYLPCQILLEIRPGNQASRFNDEQSIVFLYFCTCIPVLHRLYRVVISGSVLINGEATRVAWPLRSAFHFSS